MPNGERTEVLDEVAKDDITDNFKKNLRDVRKLGGGTGGGEEGRSGRDFLT